MKNIYILTTDRYWPWDGNNIDRADRIWNNFDEKIGFKYIIITSGLNYKRVKNYKKHIILNSKFTIIKFYYFSTISIKVILNYLKHRNRRLLLGIVKFRRFYFFKLNFKWLWSYALLRSFFKKNKVDAIIYHGEFNDWGLSIIWACRDAKVKCFAYQHGVIYPGFHQYSITDEEYDILPMPDLLFLFSKQAEEIANKITTERLPKTIVGSARFNTKYVQFKKKENEKILILPTTTDYKQYIEYLTKYIKKYSKNKQLIFKPHPLRVLPKSIEENYNITFDSLEKVFNEVFCVILSAGSSAVEALRRQIPVIVVREFCDIVLSPYQKELPGLFICKSFADALLIAGKIEKEKLAKNRSKYHDTARYFVEDLNRNKILKTIEYYL